MLPLPPAFVVTADAARLAQFREAWAAVGLPDCVAEWRACVCPSAASHGINGARGRFNADPRIQRIRASYAAAFSAALKGATP